MNDDYRVFWRELWDFVGSQEPVLPTRLIKDLYEIAPKKDWPNKEPHLDLYWCACRIASFLKQRLPDHLHARMVLSKPNEFTKKYVALLVYEQEMQKHVEKRIEELKVSR